MKPVWFRVALMSLASCMASFAVVDAVLWARSPSEVSLYAATTAPTPAPRTVPVVTAEPAPSRLVSRSLFETISEARQGKPEKTATFTTANFVLRGAVITAAQSRALIAVDADAPGVWVEKGEVVSGYLVAYITPFSVRISRDGVSTWLTLTPKES